MSHLYENIEKCLALIFNVKAVVALEDPGVNKFDWKFFLIWNRYFKKDK